MVYLPTTYRCVSSILPICLMMRWALFPIHSAQLLVAGRHHPHRHRHTISPPGTTHQAATATRAQGSGGREGRGRAGIEPRAHVRMHVPSCRTCLASQARFYLTPACDMASCVSHRYQAASACTAAFAPAPASLSLPLRSKTTPLAARHRRAPSPTYSRYGMVAGPVWCSCIWRLCLLSCG